MGSYRTWEANRKVFLYPESYLRPDLRREKTPLFVELERSLTSSTPTKHSLEQLYKRYIDQFQILWQRLRSLEAGMSRRAALTVP